ncbi:MAG: LLM class F420-dependent oxidoreductase [Chloroflexia bacterium]
MHFGVHIEATDQTMDIVALGRLVEALGFESLFLPEHTHLPVAGASIHPSGPHAHARLPRFLDPFIALAAVASATTTLRLGTGVCLVPQHDPITLAKQIATLDFISGGRFLFGIGAGWNREELHNHGVDPATRFRRLREHILAMRAIWTEDEAAYHGDFVRFGPLWSWPKPAQRPHPPIIVGGEGPRVLDRVLDYGDEWGPNAEDGLEDRVRNLHRRATTLGRPPIPVTAFHVRPDLPTLRSYAAAGVTRSIFSLRAPTEPEIRATLDQLAALIAQYRAG